MSIAYYKAIKSSPVPLHVHSTMFVQGETYKVKAYPKSAPAAADFVEVTGLFKNSLGGQERKSQGVNKSICREYLQLIEGGQNGQ